MRGAHGRGSDIPLGRAPYGPVKIGIVPWHSRIERLVNDQVKPPADRLSGPFGGRIGHERRIERNRSRGACILIAGVNSPLKMQGLAGLTYCPDHPVPFPIGPRFGPITMFSEMVRPRRTRVKGNLGGAERINTRETNVPGRGRLTNPPSVPPGMGIAGVQPPRQALAWPLL